MLDESWKSPDNKKVINLVWAQGINSEELNALREQVETALRDPDYSIVANYEIHWDQIPADKNVLARIVWSDIINEKDVEALREEVDMALADPDHAIVVNYPVQWHVILK